MGEFILVTGGARSGKSSFAEETVKSFGERILYIATAIPFDEEMKLRVEKHKARRPSNWDTLEKYKEFDTQMESHLTGKSGVLLDCITVMITNIMMEMNVKWDEIRKEDIKNVENCVYREVEKLMELIKRTSVEFVLVTNEVGMGIVPEYPISRLFRDIAGRVNQMLAKNAREVYLCVSGISVKIK
ncbi:MAG: bifunctional adenosylcobinamide kinase/adenosylcobinamide-phosphate guanylyltransferase [Clostridia bacterium]|nr:bifunctional adenosylcobinamide kinase/adenosylcobinamide-phosphate guanylyltransferase [Clostridia bacterium]